MLGKSPSNQLPLGFSQSPHVAHLPISLATDLAAHGATHPISEVGSLNWYGLVLEHGRVEGRLFDLGSSFFVQMIRAVDGAVVKH